MKRRKRIVAGADVPDKLPAAVRGAGGGEPDQDGLLEPGDGVRAQLPALHVARPTRYSGKCTQRDDLPQDSHHQPRHVARARPAVTE